MKTTRWRSLRLALMLVGFVVCVAPLALGQEIINNELVGEDGFVSPGDNVIAQEFVVRNQVTVTSTPTAATGGFWTDENDAILTPVDCATEADDGGTLQLGTFGFAIPLDAVILGIVVEVLGAMEIGGGLEIELVTQGTAAPDMKTMTNLPNGVCVNAGWDDVGAADDLWGRSWTPAQINGDFRVDITADVAATQVAHVDSIKVHVTYAQPSTFDSVTIWNTALPAFALEGEHVDKIEIFRKRDDQKVGSQTTTSQLAKLTGVGIPVDISATYDDFVGEEVYEILVYLENDVPLITEFTLGGTRGVINGGAPQNCDYGTNPAEQFEIGPVPDVQFDGLIDDSNVYPDQRFLAGRILVDANNTPFETTITEVTLENDPAGVVDLQGQHVDSIEVRRANNGTLLGQASSTERAKLATTGSKITTSSNNKVSAYGEVQLEIWVTLADDAPAGRQLQLLADVEIDDSVFQAGEDDPAGDQAPLYTVGDPGGFEEITNLDLDGGRIFSSQRFLAQRIEVKDDDLDPYDVTTTSLTIQNIADPASRLADNQIARIEVVRAVDGAVMGEITNATGLNAGTVRIFTTDANLSLDDTIGVIEVWITLKSSVPHERMIQLLSTIWHTEGAEDFGRVHDAGPDSAEFITGPTVGEGFEEETPTTLTSQEVFQGARFLAQELKLEDDDFDPYGITVTSLMIRNMSPDNRLADTNVARVEVRRKSDDALLGDFVDPVGLSLAGVRVTTGANNAVMDDSIVELEIWITLKTTIPLGRKLKLESIVWHTEGTAAFETVPLVGPATFTTAEGDPPTNVDFTWEPADPSFEDEIVFTPAADIGDPEGAIANATFAWDFGDGTDVLETEGTAEVLHTYAGGGTFDVTLDVTGEDGLTSSMTQEVVVEGPPNAAPEIVEITTTPENPAVNDDVDFDAEIDDPDQPAGTAFDYLWEFGDEDDSTSEDVTPRFSYDTAGTYTVTLTVTDAQDATHTTTFEVSVGNEPPTIGGLTATPTAPNTGENVTLQATTYADPDGDPVGHYEWDFGDGATNDDGVETIVHVYGAPGTYTVEVVAVDDRGGRSVARTLDVTVEGPTRVVMRAFPNPAATTATIAYFLPTGATNPELWIFDLGRNQVLRQALAAGGTEFEWDLRDSGGGAVANGLYLCMITATSATDRTIVSDAFRLLIAR